MTTIHDQFDKNYGIRTDGQAHLGPVNLDCMPVDDLRLAHVHPALHQEVRLYALMRLQAHNYRVNGDISRASRVEEKMEFRYENYIPKPCRW